MLTREQVLELLEYDESENKLFWKPRGYPRWDNRWAGKEAFTSVSSKGYLTSRILGKAYLLHTVLWLIWHNEYPIMIDHIDRNKLNNSKTNLQLTTYRDNNKNKGFSQNNTSGHTGVYQTPNGKYRAHIQVNKKKYHLGQGLTFEQAVARYLEAKSNYNFGINHGV